MHDTAYRPFLFRRADAYAGTGVQIEILSAHNASPRPRDPADGAFAESECTPELQYTAIPGF